MPTAGNEPKKTRVKNGTVVKICVCANSFQDAKYGLQMRVHNLAAADASHCTSCGRGLTAKQREKWNLKPLAY